MSSFLLYLNAITTLIPVFSALSCGIMISLSIGDSLSLEEKKLKSIVAFYFGLAAIGWFTTFCYGYYPKVFVFLNVPCMLTFTLIPVLFYRIIYFLTHLEQKDRFSLLHYLIPAILTIVLLVWSFFVPFDIQLEIVNGKGLVIPAGYETYTKLFTSKPALRALFGIIYYAMIILLLVRYYKKACAPKSLVRKPAKWVFFLVGISVASMLSSMLPTFTPRSVIFTSVWTFIAAIGIATQHILLTYHIIRRKYMLYLIYPEASQVRNRQVQKEKTDHPTRRHHSGKITQQKFNAYLQKEKPYLRSDFRITELVDVFDVNRSEISGFINEEYGMNFNAYINQWRLKEMKRLAALPSNRDQNVNTYVTKAGFNDLRQYYRVLSRERYRENDMTKINELTKK
ncbi:MAG: AraC family transcriptional regulator [Bacteroidales bacterium]|nr:AraC family transcriptional regulator [Bacteroidales bacterium]